MLEHSQIVNLTSKASLFNSVNFGSVAFSSKELLSDLSPSSMVQISIKLLKFSHYFLR